jgi:hypothetical protein
MSAADTIVGVVGASGGVAGFLALWQNHTRAQAAARSQREQQRRQQADKVSCWAASNLALPDGYADLYIRNASELPVYKVEVFHHRANVPANPVCRFDSVPPGDPTTEEWMHEWVGTSWSRHERPMSVMNFVDAQGMEWHRDRWGQLHEGHWQPPLEQQADPA